MRRCVVLLLMGFIVPCEILADQQRNDFFPGNKQCLNDAKKINLARLNPERIMTQVQTFKDELTRRICIRYAAYGVLGAAGAGLITYGACRYFAPQEEQASASQSLPTFNQDQRNAIKTAERQAMQRYYETLEQQRTFSGHVKKGAWYGVEAAIGTFILGMLLASFDKGKELTKTIVPSLFVGDKDEYTKLYLDIKTRFSRLYETLYGFVMQEETGQHSVHSDVLYAHFCGQIVADYTALIYRLEVLLSFLFVYGEHNNPQGLDSIRTGADMLDGVIQELAIELELVINRSEQRSLASVAAHFKNCYVYAVKFMCSCGEALYGDSFCPV